MYKLKFTGISLILAMLFHNNTLALDHNFCDRLINYCRYMSNRNLTQDSIKIIFNQGRELKPEKTFTKQLKNKKLDSIFFYYKYQNECLGPNFLTIHKIMSQHYVEAYFDGSAPYEMDLFTNLPHYESKNANNISYRDLVLLFGNPIPAKIQPKDTYNCYFIYTNPTNQKKVKIEVVSFNSPKSDYNMIYSMNISNVEFKES